MTSKPSVDLMGAAEIGRLLGGRRQRVQQLVKSDGFPAPLAVLDTRKVAGRGSPQVGGRAALAYTPVQP